MYDMRTPETTEAKGPSDICIIIELLIGKVFKLSGQEIQAPTLTGAAT